MSTVGAAGPGTGGAASAGAASAPVAERVAARLPSPTTRGAVVAATGTCLVVVGLSTALPALVRAGVLALALPVVAAALLLAARPRASVVRTLEPGAVPVGTEARVRLAVEVSTALPLVSLLAQDARSPDLGARSRFVIAAAARTRRGRPGAPTSVTYRVRPTRRGSHRVGPLSITLTDPLSLVRAAPLPVAEVGGAGSAGQEGATLLATPVVVPLPGDGGEVVGRGAGERSALAAGAGGEPAAGVRAYRSGDDVRRVHWRARARTDHLMVREDERSAAHRAVVVLATAGPWDEEGFERAVSVSASVVARLGSHGAPVELWAGRVVTGPVEDLVRALALVSADPPRSRRRPARRSGQARARGAGHGPGPSGGGPRLGASSECSRVVVVVSGLAPASATAALAPLVRPGVPAGAVVVDTPSRDGRSGAPGDLVPALRAQGWRVAEVDRDQDLAEVLPTAWAALAAGSGARGAA